MASRLNPYLNLPGTARQAMGFYAEVFGGDLASHTFAEFGARNVYANPEQVKPDVSRSIPGGKESQCQ